MYKIIFIHMLSTILHIFPQNTTTISTYVYTYVSTKYYSTTNYICQNQSCLDQETIEKRLKKRERKNIPSMYPERELELRCLCKISFLACTWLFY